MRINITRFGGTQPNKMAWKTRVKWLLELARHDLMGRKIDLKKQTNKVAVSFNCYLCYIQCQVPWG